MTQGRPPKDAIDMTQTLSEQLYFRVSPSEKEALIRLSKAEDHAATLGQYIRKCVLKASGLYPRKRDYGNE